MAAGSALSHGEERDNFFKLTLLVFRDGNEKLRQFFKSQWPVVYQNKTGTPPPSPWTDIPNDAAELKKIETKPLKFQFKDQETQFSSGNTKTWDFTLLTKILKDSTLKFITPSSPESDAIKELKEIRNKLIGHAADAKIPTVVFNTEWPKAFIALKVFGLTQKEIDQVIEDVKKPIDVLKPILQEILKFEHDILNAVEKVEEQNQVRHKETIATIKQESEDVKETIRQEIEKSSRPKRQCSKDLRITKAQSDLLDARLKYFDKVIATDLLDTLPCLSQEQKDEITKTRQLCTRQTALKTLFDIIKTCENGFEKLVISLVQAGLEHLAVLLDPDFEDHVCLESEDNEVNFVSIDGTAFDIRIPVRIIDYVKLRKPDIEAKIAKKYNSDVSEDTKELRKAFSKVLPRGVHFVHTKQFGEGPGNNDTASNNTTNDSVVCVFRISKEQAVDDMNRIHTDGTLSAHIKETINLQSLATDINVLDLELLNQECDYQEIYKILNQDTSTDLVLDTTTEVTEDETMDEITHKVEKIKIRDVYLDGHYHKTINLRDYQKELAAPALAGQNTIICAPTNSGKTFVAMEIAKQHLDAHRDTASNDPRKVIFVVNKQNLVLQQRSRFEDYLSTYKTSDLSGNNSTSISLDSLLNHCDIVVLTAQILVNALEDKSVALSGISLLIFDECHHTNKEEPYNRIMMNYIERKHSGEKHLPQVVGLTASLGVGQATSQPPAIEHVLQICANLDTNTISTVQEHKTNLETLVTGDVPDMKIITVPNDTPNVFDMKVNQTMKQIETIISDKYGGCDSVPNSDRQHESYRQWIELLEQSASKNNNNELNKCAEHLRKYHEALLINNFTRIQDALDFLDDYTHHQHTDICPWLEEIYERTKTTIKASKDRSCNPLLSKMEDIIVGFHENEIDGNPKGIVFCRTRSYAVAIKKWMLDSEKLKKIVKPEVLLGSGGGQHGLTQSEQESVIKKFKNGDVNIVIATSVAEEGLDISDCKYVIRYDVKTNEISRVQSRGRIRAKEGTYVYLSDNRSRGAEHELKNQSKETLMDQAVVAVQELMNRDDYNHTMRKLQNRTLISFRVKKEQETAPKQAVSESEKLPCLCRKCGEFMCNVQDLRLLKQIHRVVINDDIYEKMDVVDHTKPYNVDDIVIKKKISCRKCHSDWGTIITVEGTEWPCIKIQSIKTQINDKQSRTYRKWKDFPYSVAAASSIQDLTDAQANV